MDDYGLNSHVSFQGALGSYVTRNADVVFRNQTEFL
jgi:hypothetical protein